MNNVLPKDLEIHLIIKELNEENKKLVNQWNELKSWLKNYSDYDDFINVYAVLNKLNKLEGKNDNK